MRTTGRLLGVMAALVLLGAACTSMPLEGMQTLVAALPGQSAPLGGRVAPLPTPDPSRAATATPPASSITLPTAAPTVSGPLATLTAVAGLFPTVDLEATPYAIVLDNRPHFIEFQAAWCSACNAMRSSVRRLEATYGERLNFHILNVDRLSSRDLALRYEVAAIPNIVLLDSDGALVTQMVGFQTEEQLFAAVEALLTAE